MWTIVLTAIKTFLGNQLNALSYILIAALIASLGWSASLKMDVWSLESDLKTCKDEKEKIEDENGYLHTDKARYESAIEQGNFNAESKQENAKKVIEKEKIVYKDRIEYIKEYVHDSNKTECENSIAILMRNGL
ncbi:hypothetical protein [Sulfurospirillum cavolei]|uniref:hypothetical protein n=1 Tax=Sulfurospirillum cavolei TaxID=366522 RepID=UPI003FA1EFAE